MARIEQPYICDVCGKAREKDANHWLILFAVELSHGCSITRFIAYSWYEADPEAPGARHICGQACAQVKFEIWMQTGSLEDPAKRPVSKTLTGAAAGTAATIPPDVPTSDGITAGPRSEAADAAPFPPPADSTAKETNDET